MKLGIFGGTFNPVHIGHLAMADDVLKTLGYDRILFVPAFIPPHKEAMGMESPEHRIGMLKAAFKYDDRFEVETCEIDRGGTSYMIDTVHHVIEKYKGQLDGKPGLIMGTENAVEFDKWKNAKELSSIVELIAVKRIKDNNLDTSSFENTPKGTYSGGFDKDDSGILCEGFEFVQLKNLVLPVSSTEVRTRISKGFGWRYLVPQGVFEYIVEHKLYGYSN